MVGGGNDRSEQYIPLYLCLVGGDGRWDRGDDPEEGVLHVRNRRRQVILVIIINLYCF